MSRYTVKNKSSSRSKYISRSRSKSKNKTKTKKQRKQKGCSVPYLDIEYGDGNGNITVSNQQLTKDQTINQPTVTIQNANPESIYLITMLDPDAPNGQGQSGNHTWTHWVITYKGNQQLKEYVSYSPPSPPAATHRYIFSLYDITNTSENLNIEPLIDNTQRGTYYDEVLKQKIQKLNPVTTNTTTQFTVKAAGQQHISN
jgi:phosphatidylethanolamine-binding protein (PEBP) family uncharacterized protein